MTEPMTPRTIGFDIASHLNILVWALNNLVVKLSRVLIANTISFIKRSTFPAFPPFATHANENAISVPKSSAVYCKDSGLSSTGIRAINGLPEPSKLLLSM